MNAPPPASILIVRLSALGDVVHVLPSLNALREAFPQAKIGWAVENRAAKILEGHPQLDRLHKVPRKTWTADLKRGRGLRVLGSLRRTVAELRAEEYDVALDFQSNFRSGAITRLSGARRRIGQPPPHSKEGSRLFFSEVPPPIPFEAHKIERNLNLLGPLGVTFNGAPQPGRFPTAGLADSPFPPRGDRPRAVLHPGVSAHGAVKAWRGDRFAQLGARLVEAGVEVLFSWGGEGERIEAEGLVAQTPGALLCPPTDLLQLVELLAGADLYIGVDSGPLHIAAQLGTPTLGLYGPKHVSTYGPFWPQGRVVPADYPCSPCRYRRCPRPEVQVVTLQSGDEQRISPCMDTIDVEAVLASALDVLGKS